MFICRQCNQVKSTQHNGGTGYGEMPNPAEDTICYDCCASLDKGDMLRHGDATLYLTERGITNWPGTLHFAVKERRKGRHNIAGSRTDVWFNGPDNRIWHGIQYGEWTEIVHCKRTKQERRIS